jgi:hypothetical protein
MAEHSLDWIMIRDLISVNYILTENSLKFYDYTYILKQVQQQGLKVLFTYKLGVWDGRI